MIARDKIKSLKEICDIVHDLRWQGKTIITTNGSYDIFHAGHVRQLEQSKEYGDVLIVGLNSDASVKAYKSEDRPIIPQAYRAEVVAALACVDFVFLFDEVNPIAFLEKIQPDVHTNDISYGQECVERETVEKYGGRIKLIERAVGLSSTDIIDAILSIYCQTRKEV